MHDAVGKMRVRVRAPRGTRPTDGASLGSLVAAGAFGSPSSVEGSRNVLLIRRLAVSIALPAAQPGDAIGTEIGRRLGNALSARLRAVPPDEVVRFPSVADYVLHFLAQLLADRPTEAWYFRPLRIHLGNSFGDTLANLARAEPEAWPEVVRRLERDGWIPAVQRRTGWSRQHLRAPVLARRLTIEEARPLFRTARIIARAAATGDVPPVSRRQREETALGRYLANGRSAPDWTDPRSIGECVARMVRWLLDRAESPQPLMHAPAVAAVAAVLREQAWLDPAPVMKVVRDAVRAVPALSPQALPVPANAVNRTLALRILAAADGLASERERRVEVPGREWDRDGVGKPPDGASPSNDLVDLLWDAADELAGEKVTSVDLVEAVLRDPARSVTTPACAALAGGSGPLREPERRQLARRLAQAAATRARRDLTTDAVGVFLLIRPLLDLGYRSTLPGSLTGFARHAAGIDDIAVRLFATGAVDADATEWRAVDWDALKRVAERARTFDMAPVGFPADPDAAAPWLFDIACRQFARWLRGFERSSPAYVLRTFVRRPGRLVLADRGGLEVIWPASPYDVVLEMAGYFDPIPTVPWWAACGVRWIR